MGSIAVPPVAHSKPNDRGTQLQVAATLGDSQPHIDVAGCAEADAELAKEAAEVDKLEAIGAEMALKFANFAEKAGPSHAVVSEDVVDMAKLEVIAAEVAKKVCGEAPKPVPVKVCYMGACHRHWKMIYTIVVVIALGSTLTW